VRAFFYVQDTWLRPIDALLVEGDSAFYVLGVARGLIPLSVLAGLVAIGVRQARLTHLFAGLGDNPRRAELEPALRAALGDSRLEVWWWSNDPPGYVGRSGEQRTTVQPGTGGATIELTASGGPMAVVRLDRVFLDDPRFAKAVSNAVRLVGDHERLSEQVRAQLDEVRASRRRILTAAAIERARLERDLHDGSQQRLVGLALQLRLMRRSVDPHSSPELAESIDLASKNLAEALAELRELARGIHPAALTDGGLTAALPLIADRVPVPIELGIEVEGRLDPTIESTLYFVASEALTNVAKHSAAERVTVELRADRDAVVLAVTDDGCGGASIDAGTGIAGLRDRVEAVGGALWLESPADGGTRVVARIPLGAEIDEDGSRHG
jgi:signal transduction histidine kinase